MVCAVLWWSQKAYIGLTLSSPVLCKCWGYWLSACGIIQTNKRLCEVQNNCCSVFFFMYVFDFMLFLNLLFMCNGLEKN